MKRIRVLCGICKGTKYYSIHRGITKVSSIIACENCRHFYQKLKRSPFALDCISPIKGSCYRNCSFMKTRCKGCWAMQLLDSCPHPVSLYASLSSWLSEECRKQLRGDPRTLDEVPPDAVGKVTLEVYKNDEWVEAPSSDVELAQLQVNNEEEDETAESEEQKEYKKNKKSRSNQDKTGYRDAVANLAIADLAIDVDQDIDVEEEEAIIDDPVAMETDVVMIKDQDSNSTGVPPRSKSSERIKRKRRKPEYFTKPISGRRNKGHIYGSDGKINKTGMDLCDCLQPECVGCHFPCPKCRSPKCGNECRVNRRWYYEKVEVEGTKMSWVNRFVPKT